MASSPPAGTTTGRGDPGTAAPAETATDRERVMLASGPGRPTAAVTAAARAARLGPHAPVHPGIASAAASVVGPLFATYVLWVLRDVVARGGRRIHFLARDGQVLVPICERLARWLGVEVTPVYTYASRQAFLLAALSGDDRELVERALDAALYDRIPFSGALTSLRYPADDIASVAHDTGIDPDARRGDLSAEQLAALHDALLHRDLLDALRARAATARTATLAYLDSVGLFDSGEAFIVDLGWRGTTQRRLEALVDGRVELVGYYLGLSSSVLPPDAQYRVWTTSTPLKPALLEVMASADHTSVQGFGLAADGAVVPTPAIAEDADLIAWGAREQQDIALGFVDHLVAAVELDDGAVEEIHAALESAAVHAWRHFRMSPTPAEAEAYGGVRHSDDVNHVRYRELAPTLSSSDVARHVLDPASRAAATHWYLGSLARSRRHLVPRLVSTGIDRALVLSARLRTWRRTAAARRGLDR